MTLAPGQSFFTPETQHVRRHLWVVVSAPQQDRVAIANLSSSPSPDPDPPEVPAVVSATEHPSLTHQSFIRCEQARLVTRVELERLIRVQTLSPTRPAPPGLVTKMQVALMTSHNTPLEVKVFLHSQGSE